MVRLVVLILLSIGLGTVLGNFQSIMGNRTEERFYLVETNEKTPKIKTTGENAGLAVVELPEGTSFKFGTMKHGTSMSHEFPIKNVGTAPLIVKNTGSTCKCTVGKLNKEVLMPGESEMIKLEWRGVAVNPSYAQTATFQTNCLNHAELKFQVEGAVIDSFVLKPSEIGLGDFAADTGTSREFSVFCYTEGVDLSRFEWSNPETAKYIKLEHSEFQPSEDPDNAKAIKAYKVKLNVLPGLTVGNFSGNVLLHTNNDLDRLELRVGGRSVSDMSVIAGSSFNAESGILTLDKISAAEGHSMSVWLVLRGEEHATTEVTAEQDNASETLKVSVGEKRVEKTRTLVPIKFEVPKGAKEAYYPGTGKGTFVKVLLKANSSKPTELPIHVKLIVTK
ncbi:MAG: DUF1573 domain-containing protein [Pirellulales bacterium]